ncbi:hypothetical protein [Embleya sp. NPDC020630]|uniref:hypothetical protein n=1 Tax=Embleya sp. NPDC020630 TaxID=3363979 RepID=UPI0037A6392D
MRDKFERGMRDLPDTTAPHDTIVAAGGRARRRRRVRVGGAVVAAVVAAAGIATIGLTSRTSGHTATSHGSPTASVSAPTPGASGAQPTPQPTPSAVPSSAVAYAEELGTVSLARGEAGGHTWELVRVRSYREFDASTDVTIPDKGAPTAPSRTATHTGYCDDLVLNLDGRLDKRASGLGCADQPLWKRTNVSGYGDFAIISLGGTSADTSSVGHLGTISYGVVPKNATKVVATYDADKTKVEAPTHKFPGSDEAYFVMFVPRGTGHGITATLLSYTAEGTRVGEEVKELVVNRDW